MAEPLTERAVVLRFVATNQTDAAVTKSDLIANLAQRYPALVAKDAEYAVKMILAMLHVI